MNTSGWHWWVEFLNGYSVQQRATGRIFLDPGIVKNHSGNVGGGIESKSVGVPSIAAVEGLQWQIAGLGRDGDPQHFVLGTCPGGAKGEGVQDALLHWY